MGGVLPVHPQRVIAIGGTAGMVRRRRRRCPAWEVPVALAHNSMHGHGSSCTWEGGGAGGGMWAGAPLKLRAWALLHYALGQAVAARLPLGHRGWHVPNAVAAAAAGMGHAFPELGARRGVALRGSAAGAPLYGLHDGAHAGLCAHRGRRHCGPVVTAGRQGGQRRWVSRPVTPRRRGPWRRAPCCRHLLRQRVPEGRTARRQCCRACSCG